ncbi:MAG: TonB-dependent receptor [Acidobacteria bacterium]|nr:TonB-dependent receptor [Acidobacteriota bacterium]MBA3884126.1 TonB-dependent receptor [Acidobacteriota bacterium]
MNHISGGVFRWGVASALVLTTVALAGGSLAAQEQRAAIEGVVRDASGAVLSGVAVEARSAGGVVVSTTTDVSGSYRFPALVPGTYEVRALLQGFTPASVVGVSVAVGQLKTVDLGLSIGGVTEAVQVSAEPPIINVKQSERSTHIREEFIDLLPKGRDFSTLVAQAPGVNTEGRFGGGISIDGASAGENRFVVDGVETTQMVNGSQGKSVVTEFIDEVEVRSSGYTAEFGGSTGGVINVVSKTGTNVFHGEGVFHFSGDALTASRRPTLRLGLTDSTVSEFVTFPEDDQTSIEPGFTLGGPILQNRAWFFGGYLPSITSTERTVTLTANGQTLTRDQDITTQNITGSVRSRFTDRLTGRAAFNMSSSKTEGLLPALSGTDSPQAIFDVDTEFPNWSLSGHLDFVASNRLYLGVRGGYFFSDVETFGIPQGPRILFQRSNIGLAGVPAEFQRSTGFQNVTTNFETRKDEKTRLNVQADATYYANFAGRHTFKGGVQVDRIGNNVDAGESGHLTQIFWNESFRGERGAFGYYRIRSNGLRPEFGFLRGGDINSNNVGLFIQDAWTLNDRLTLNLGLRTENEHVPSFTTGSGIASTAIKWDFADKVAPRLGFAYDVRGDGRWKAYGSWGLFYDIMKLELPRGSFGGEHWLEYWFTLDTPDFTALNPAGCPPACPGQPILGPVNFRSPSNAPGDETIDPGIEPTRLQEVVFGLDHAVTNTISLGVRYVHKQVDRAVEDIGFLDENQNEIFKIGNPGFGQSRTFVPEGGTAIIPFPKAVRDYDGLEFSVNRNLSNRWALRASYLWSRLYGNYSGLAQSDEPGRLSPNVGRNFDSPVMTFNERGEPVFGRLATDRPHQLKAHFIYVLPIGTTVGVSQFVSSGVPVTREAAFIPGNNFPVMFLGRGSDGRTPVFSQTDLNVQQEFRIPGNQRLQLGLNILNLFDEENITERFRTQLASGQAVNVTEPQFFAGVNTQALIAAQGLRQDPRFLLPSAFQAPLQARVSVRWLF